MISETERTTRFDLDGHHAVVELVLLPGGNHDQAIVDPHRAGERSPGVRRLVDDIDQAGGPPLPQRRRCPICCLAIVADRRPQLDHVGIPGDDSLLDRPDPELPQDVGSHLDVVRRHRDDEGAHQSSRRSDVRYCSRRST